MDSAQAQNLRDLRDTLPETLITSALTDGNGQYCVGGFMMFKNGFEVPESVWDIKDYNILYESTARSVYGLSQYELHLLVAQNNMSSDEDRRDNVIRHINSLLVRRG